MATAVAAYGCGVVYRVAATMSKVVRGRPAPAGELHAYLDGRLVSVCGRSLGDDLVTFNTTRWSARPIGLLACKICASKAR